jgi:hypothetical protein
MVFFSLGAASLSAQQTVTLDDAIQSAADYINGTLKQGARTAVLNIQSDSPDVADYIIKELTSRFVNGKKLGVVDRDRARLLLSQQELDFQDSGLVSDETALNIGRYLGAEIIISGSFKQYGAECHLEISALEVETTRHLATQTYNNIYIDSRLAALFKGTRQGTGAAPPVLLLWNGNTSWKHKWFYPGIRAGAAMREYVLNTTRTDITAEPRTTFEIAALCEIQIAGALSLQPELVYSEDIVTIYNPDYGAIQSSSSTLAVPLLVKLTWRPRVFYLAAFTGPRLVLPLGRMRVTQDGAATDYDFSKTWGLTVGVNAGVRLGQGLLFLDLRYSGDLGFVQSNGTGQYRRNIYSASLGFNYGLLNKGGRKVSR